MNLRTTRTRLGAAAVAALAAGALAVGTSPASASASSGYVSGADTYTDDFGDEGLLSTSSHSSSNATCLWQIILLAEGANESDGTDFDMSDIDGHFGPNTQHATKRLQVSWGLADSFSEADGKVGPNTFGYADSKLRYLGGSTASGGNLHVRYQGAKYYFDVYRTDGKYRIYHNDAWHTTSYTSNTCD
ncbi:peptidoglycan-binding domain-containing protein [Streptomyces sp. NPDC005009]